MIKYNDLKDLSITRAKEAKVLYRNHLYDGCVYLCGYVVELSLKAMICKHLAISEYPDDGKMKSVFSTHEFDRLQLLAGLSKEIDMVAKPRLFKNWSLLTTWSPSHRYKPIGTYNQQNANEMLKALNNRTWGFFSWIQTKW